MTVDELEKKVRKEQRKKAKKQRGNRRLLWTFLGLLLLACGLAVALVKLAGEERGERPEAQTFAPSSEPADGVNARIDVIDVGQGSAMLIVSGGEAMLVDGGGREHASKTVAYLKERGVSRLKYIVATHYDADHLYGAVGALEAFPVEKVLVPDYETDTYVYQSFRNHLAGKDAEVIHPSPGDSYTLGKCRFTVLAPCSTAYEAENDYSLAFRLTDGAHSLLVTGDAELASETEMLANNRGDRRLKSDVYLVGHHGSASSSSAAFLAAVKPSFAVISCGAGNDYGHPKASVLSRLKLLGTALYRTDKQGDIVCLFTEEGILWEQEPADDFTAG